MNRSLKVVTAAAVLSLLSACGAGSVSGSVSGISLGVQDMIFFVLKDTGGKTQSVVLLAADKPNLCDTLKANRQPKSATSLVLALQNIKVDGTTVTTLAPDIGQYTVLEGGSQVTNSGLYASGAFNKTDANCTSSLTSAASVAKSGFVKVTTLKADSSGSLQGTFDVSIGTQADKLTGSINARFCDITALQNNPSCE